MDCRIDVNMHDHPKIRALRKTHGELGEFSLIHLWLYVARCCADGVIKDMTPKELAEVSHYRGEPIGWINRLVEIRLLDRGENGNYIVHDWLKYNLYAATAPIRKEIARNAARISWEKRRLNAKSIAPSIAPSITTSIYDSHTERNAPSINSLDSNGNTTFPAAENILSPSPPDPPILNNKRIKEMPDKEILGEFENVFLTLSEFGKLKKRFGELDAFARIEKLSQYIASKGKRYKDHYATILSWDRRDNKQ